VLSLGRIHYTYSTTHAWSAVKQRVRFRPLADYLVADFFFVGESPPFEVIRVCFLLDEGVRLEILERGSKLSN